MDLERGKVMSFLFGKRENEGREEKVGEERKFVGTKRCAYCADLANFVGLLGCNFASLGQQRT